MLRDLVQETANNPGTGLNVSLGGAPVNRLSFVGEFGNGARCFYAISDGTQTEWGVGTLTAGSPNVLTRTTVLRNTAGNDLRLDFKGAVQVYNEAPSAYLVLDRMVALDADWAASNFDPGTTETAFFGTPIPLRSRAIRGTIYAKGQVGSGVGASMGLKGYVLRPDGGVHQTVLSITMSGQASQLPTLAWKVSVDFASGLVNATGWTFRFSASRDNPFVMQNYGFTGWARCEP